MTTLYRPVLIETAAQADALPVGTIVTGTRFGVIEKANHGCWWVGTLELPDHVAVGCSALVPVEAEEEHTRPVHLYASTAHVAPSSSAHKPSRRYVTPWEPA